MNWTEEHRRQILDLIDSIPGGETYHKIDGLPQPDFRRLVVLPVLFDGGGTVVLCPDGNWKSVWWESPAELKELACFDARIERGLRFEAAQKYASLKWLVPIRQADAVDCHECGGDGVSEAARLGVTSVVCWCGGLGWVLPNE